MRGFVSAFAVVFGLLIQFGCTSEPQKITRGFYHWKTHYSPSPADSKEMQSLGVAKLYVKYFDVDWPEEESEAVPQAKVTFGEMPTQAIIPTVFITNRAIQKTGEANAISLADKVFRLIFDRHPKELAKPKEVQIDCDWTAGTRAAYFALLSRLNTRLDSQNIALSATIRLHQLKFPKQTGVPPVDRGMLMFYNMGDLDNPTEDNSILDVAEGKKYLGAAETYALPLDAALPLFGWGVLIRRGKPIKLLNNLRRESTVNIPWFSKVSDNVLQVDSSHYFWGHYLYEGDEIRLEEVEVQALMEAAELLQNKLKAEDRTVVLYHLDSLTLAHYEQQTLDSVFGVFR
jgi:hypothetical protein